MSEPRAIFPNALPMQLWRQRVEPAAVTVRCGRGKRRCDRVAFVYETPGSAVVVFHQHIADRPAVLNETPQDYKPDGDKFKRFDADQRRALLRGSRDDHGTVVTLEDDDYWNNRVDVGCGHHLGFVHVDRAQLMNALREARRLRRPVEIPVS